MGTNLVSYMVQEARRVSIEQHLPSTSEAYKARLLSVFVAMCSELLVAQKLLTRPVNVNF
jgi:hypothetical protein